MSKKNNKVIDEFKQRVSDELRKLKESPQEHPSNRTMVGSDTLKNKFNYAWQPHNHRLYFDFSKENFNPNKPTNRTLQKWKSMVSTVGLFNPAYLYTSLNYDSEHEYQKFMCCTIRVKKNQIEVINHLYGKQWVRLSSNSIIDIHNRIDKRKKELRDHSIKTLKTFIELHGGKSQFKILRERCEEGLHGDKFLDNIPDELIIHDTYFKKEYKRKVEFKSTPYVKNYISSRAIEDISPEISQGLAANREMLKGIMEASVATSKLLNQYVRTSVPIMQDFSLNIKTHNSVLKGIDKSFRKFNSLLQKGQQKRLSDYG